MKCCPSTIPRYLFPAGRWCIACGYLEPWWLIKARELAERVGIETWQVVAHEDLVPVLASMTPERARAVLRET